MAAPPTNDVFKDDRGLPWVTDKERRLVVKINYPYRVVSVRFVGTHEEYDEIDVKEV